MGAPSGHGQRNKGHNSGRHASKSTRNKHKTAAGDGAADGGHRKTIKVRALFSFPHLSFSLSNAVCV